MPFRTLLDAPAEPRIDSSAFVPAFVAESDASEQVSSVHNSVRAYLASELFNDGHDMAEDLQQRSESPSWAPVPNLPASYRSEALSLFGNHAVLGQKGVSSDSALSGDLLTDITDVPRSLLAERHDQSPSVHLSALQHPRLSQKRYRPLEATRESSQDLADQLASTRAELEQMREQQRRLESKNILLEKCLHLNVSHEAHQSRGSILGVPEATALASSASSAATQHYVRQEVLDSERGVGLISSVRGPPTSITVSEIGNMGVEEFSSLWADYIHSIGSCLLQMSNERCNGPATNLMHQLTDESSRLLGCIKLLNHKVHDAMLHGQIDTKLANNISMDRFYPTFTALLQLSDGQWEDLMFLRRLYVTRRYVLAKQRERLITEAAGCINSGLKQVPLPGSTQVSHLAARLAKNAEEDYRVYHRCGAAGRRGILSTKQWALIIVHAYPYLPTVEQSLQAFAEFGKSSMSKADILKAAETDSMETAWQALQEYIELIGQQNSHEYLPLSSCPAFKSQAQPGAATRASMPFGTEAAINLHYNI